MALKGSDHLVDKVVDVEKFHFYASVIHLYRKVVGYVVAKSSYSRVIVRPAPFSEKVRETIDQDFGSGLTAILEHQFLSCLLATAIFAVSETARKSCLNRT